MDWGRRLISDAARATFALRCFAWWRIPMIFFKDLSADFHRRAEGDVHFSCDDGRAIADLVSRAAASGERVEMPVTVVATVPSLDPEPVASFRLTLSLKRRPGA